MKSEERGKRRESNFFSRKLETKTFLKIRYSPNACGRGGKAPSRTPRWRPNLFEVRSVVHAWRLRALALRVHVVRDGEVHLFRIFVGVPV